MKITKWLKHLYSLLGVKLRIIKLKCANVFFLFLYCQLYFSCDFKYPLKLTNQTEKYVPQVKFPELHTSWMVSKHMSQLANSQDENTLKLYLIYNHFQKLWSVQLIIIKLSQNRNFHYTPHCMFFGKY